MQFDLLRLSLLRRRPDDLFSTPDGGPVSREAWLRSLFASTIVFQHRRQTFHYVPEESGDVDGVLVGRIGKQVLSRDHTSAEDGLRPTEREKWPAALVLIDPKHHDDGQKVAMQLSPVGVPLALFSSLVAHVNHADDDAPYVIEVASISDAATFWEFVERNEGNVTSVTFELIAPNMFSSFEDYDVEMRDMREKEKARKATLTLENPDGLELNTRRVEGAVEYATRGGGSVKAKAKRRRNYNSKTKVKREYVPEPSGEKTSAIDLIKSAVFAIFRP